MGAPYAFNPTTGMLETPGGVSGAVETRVRFVEGGLGGFRRVLETPADADGGGLVGRAAAAAAASRDAGGGSMRAALFAAQSAVVAAGLFAQGLLAGAAGLNLFMTCFLDAADASGVHENSGLLHYYSPIAVTCQRLYVTLSAVALVASVDEYSRDALSGFVLQGFALREVDFLGCLSFFMAFLLSVVAVPFEDTLYYANARVPSWWEEVSASSAFRARLSRYRGVSAPRAAFALVGYACACATGTPAPLDVVRRERSWRGVKGGAFLPSRAGGGRRGAGTGVGGSRGPGTFSPVSRTGASAGRIAGRSGNRVAPTPRRRRACRYRETKRVRMNLCTRSYLFSASTSSRRSVPRRGARRPPRLGPRRARDRARGTPSRTEPPRGA